MITTLAKVKERLAIVDTANDALLTQLINEVGARFDRECDRKLERTVGHEEEFNASETVLVLGCSPVEVVTKLEVMEFGEDVWTEVTPRYAVLMGSILRLGEVLGTPAGRLRVTYTGGFVCPPATPAAGQTGLPAILESAAVEQVAMQYQLRSNVGVYRVEVSGGTYVEVADKEWVPWVRGVLRKYRRLTVA